MIYSKNLIILRFKVWLFNSIFKTYNPPSRNSILNKYVNSNAVNASQPDIRLPKIKIPEFDCDSKMFMKLKPCFKT